MRHSAIQAELWLEADKLKVLHPPGSTITLENEEYKVLYPFAVISTHVVAHLTRVKTNREVQVRVTIDASKKEATEKATIQRVELT